MVRVFTLALFALVVSFAIGSRPAWAEPPNGKAIPVHVLSIWTNDVDDQADALTQALRSRLRQTPGWSLTDSNQSFETLSIALRCPPTPNQSCLDRIGDHLHTDHFVWGTLAKGKAVEMTATLHLWTRGKPQVEATETYSDNLKDPSDESLRAVAGRIIAKLTGSPTTGTLVIRAGTAAGSVLIDGETKGRLDGGIARISVREGSHTVAVSVPGFTAPSQTITLSDGADADLSFALSPIAAAPIAATREPDQTPGPVEKKRFPLRKVIGYTGVVLGAGFLAAAAIEGANWLSDKNASDKDRKNVPTSVTDVCTTPFNAASADACARSKDATTSLEFGWIFAGVGAALAATGIWLVIGDHSADPVIEPAAKATRPTFAVLPALGMRTGGVDLKMTF